MAEKPDITSEGLIEDPELKKGGSIRRTTQASAEGTRARKLEIAAARRPWISTGAALAVVGTIAAAYVLVDGELKGYWNVIPDIMGEGAVPSGAAEAPAAEVPHTPPAAADAVDQKTEKANPKILSGDVDVKPGNKVVLGKPPSDALLSADAVAAEGTKVVDGKAVPVEETANTPPEEAVAKYELTEGDGVTQGLEKLRNQLGDDAPKWLKDLDTKEKLAEWALKNHWYSPDQIKDSVIMHKGDVLSIDAQGNLSIHNADGSLEARTDVLGRAGPEALGTRDFSDTVPSSGTENAPTKPVAPNTVPLEAVHAEEAPPVPTELPDALREQYENYARTTGGSEEEFMAVMDSLQRIYPDGQLEKDLALLGHTSAETIPFMKPDGESRVSEALSRMQQFIDENNESLPRPGPDEDIRHYMARAGLISR